MKCKHKKKELKLHLLQWQCDCGWVSALPRREVYDYLRRRGIKHSNIMLNTVLVQDSLGIAVTMPNETFLAQLTFMTGECQISFYKKDCSYLDKKLTKLWISNKKKLMGRDNIGGYVTIDINLLDKVYYG